MVRLAPSLNQSFPSEQRSRIGVESATEFQHSIRFAILWLALVFLVNASCHFGTFSFFVIRVFSYFSTRRVVSYMLICFQVIVFSIIFLFYQSIGNAKRAL